ncbi:MAG: hypothetical protein ACRDZZ_15320 [Ilumatobacteraceae bacterium]
MNVRSAFLVCAVLLGGAGVIALREATLSRHGAVAPDSTIEVIVDLRTRGAEPGHDPAQMVEALLLNCRLEVSSDLVGDIGVVGELGGNRYRAVLSPSMDRTDRRQFRGCLEDWIVDHVQLDVVHLAPIDS